MANNTLALRSKLSNYLEHTFRFTKHNSMASHISLKQLKVFTTITQHKTLTAASESLFLSKAAVSMALSELEKQIGHHLFDRVNNRLILNQEGQKLLPLADELLNRAKDIERV